MRSYLVLCVAAVLVGAVRADCDACVDGRCLKKHLLPGTSDRYGALHRATNMLYHYKRNGDNEEVIVQCNLNTATCNETAKISDVVDLTVDQRTGDVYGELYASIYKLDLVNNKKILWVPVVATIGKEIWGTVFKDKLYYSARRGGIYVFENGVSTLLAGTEIYDNIKDFIVDRNDDIYFYSYEKNSRFLKRLSKGVIYETGFWGDHTFKMTVDRDDNPIFIDQNSRAVYRVTGGRPVEIGAVADWVDRPLFDGDNNLVYYEFNSKGDIEAWHFKQERHARCTTNIFDNPRTIAEITVSHDDGNDLNHIRSSDTEPASGSSPDRGRVYDSGADGTQPW